MAIYESFNNFILRTPAFSVEKWEKYTEDIEQGNFQALLNDDYFLEAIFIASPILYEEALRFKSGGLSIKEEKSLISSLLRYFTRMSWRCTPFGLFSGCTIGNVTNNNTIILPTIDHYNRYIRMDMNCLCALIQEIEKQDEIRYVIKYYPNNSIYIVGNYLRYVEYHYYKTHRKHEIVSVEKNKYLQTILHYAKDGKTIQQLAEQIVEDGITIEDGIEFVIELIENQLLISELSPTVTGIDLLERTIAQLQNIAIEHPIHQKTLIDIQLLLFQINQHSEGKTEILYKKIIDIVKENQIDYDPQYLFQIDLIKQSISVEITQEITQDIIDVIVFLNRLTPKNQNSSLLEFSKAFYERYEEKEMPLLQVLDDEIGIGYPVNIHGDISPLLDQLMISSNNITDQQQIPWNNFHAVLLKKFISLQKDNLYEIELDDDDFNLKNIAPNWDDTPSTLAVMCKIFSYHDAKKMIYFQSCGGASAANLIGRFAYTDIGIENHIKTIIAKEETLNSDVILAEIVHLPESRIGNIIFRPHIRDYEIPYLAQSSVEKEFQIPLQDLYISIKNGIIFLKSKRLNKRIIPRLTTAHNYSMHSMPVYHFLCDLQTHGLRGGFAFRWNSIFNNYPFLPRISYHNVILSLARWIIKTEEIEKIIKGENNMEVLTQWRHDLQMPAYLMFPDGDNEFFVDMNNIRSIKTLLSAVKKRPYIHLQEFPFKKDEAIVRDIEGNHYTNEFIFGFYKK